MSRSTKYWVVADTHFGHNEIVGYCGRPLDFGARILRNVSSLVQSRDVLIHLGDVCIGNDAHHHHTLREHCSGLLWLVRGNHDRKTTTWYLRNGWDWVGDSMELSMFGHDLIFTHRPLPDTGGRLNIHGHLHNTEHRTAYEDEYHKLILMEHSYCPVDLRRLVS